RLKSSWTFRGQAAFWLTFAVALGLVGVLARVEPWLWMLLAALPVLHFFLDTERRRTEQLVLLLLEEIAAEQGLVKLEGNHETHPSSVAVGCVPDSAEKPRRVDKIHEKL